MPSRVVAFFLALILVWSGLGTIEAPWIGSQGTSEAAAHAVSEPSPAPAAGGSVEHHHLDDQPAQPQGDPGSELAGLLPALPAAVLGAPSAAKPRCGETVAVRAPCLAGLLRPPCGGRVTA